MNPNDHGVGFLRPSNTTFFQPWQNDPPKSQLSILCQCINRILYLEVSMFTSLQSLWSNENLEIITLPGMFSNVLRRPFLFISNLKRRRQRHSKVPSVVPDLEIIERDVETQLDSQSVLQSPSIMEVHPDPARLDNARKDGRRRPNDPEMLCVLAVRSQNGNARRQIQHRVDALNPNRQNVSDRFT